MMGRGSSKGKGGGGMGWKKRGGKWVRVGTVDHRNKTPKFAKEQKRS